MRNQKHPALRPEGFTPLLHGAAARDRAMVSSLLDSWASAGFSHVAPIQVDEAQLLMENQAAEAQNRAFRFMDPVTGSMLALLPDVTLGISRLARGELSDFPRPLKLSYEGQAIRSTGSAQRPARQFGQVGLEVIGAKEDVGPDLIGLALQALADLDIKDVHLTLLLPTLAMEMINEHNLPVELAMALDRKDEGLVRSLAGKKSMLFLSILRGECSDEDRLSDLLSLQEDLTQRFPSVQIKCEPFEQKGFAYQTGPSFALYSSNHHGDLGRGGWYSSSGEDCFGFTLYRDALLSASRY